jgi:hypothetical protein
MNDAFLGDELQNTSVSHILLGIAGIPELEGPRPFNVHRRWLSATAPFPFKAATH